MTGPFASIFHGNLSDLLEGSYSTYTKMGENSPLHLRAGRLVVASFSRFPGVRFFSAIGMQEQRHMDMGIQEPPPQRHIMSLWGRFLDPHFVGEVLGSPYNIVGTIWYFEIHPRQTRIQQPNMLSYMLSSENQIRLQNFMSGRGSQKRPPLSVDAVSFRQMSLFPAASLGGRPRCPDPAAHLRDPSLQQPCLRHWAESRRWRFMGREKTNENNYDETCGILR